jgi:hypothetical protein
VVSVCHETSPAHHRPSAARALHKRDPPPQQFWQDDRKLTRRNSRRHTISLRPPCRLRFPISSSSLRSAGAKMPSVRYASFPCWSRCSAGLRSKTCRDGSLEHGQITAEPAPRYGFPYRVPQRHAALRTRRLHSNTLADVYHRAHHLRRRQESQGQAIVNVSSIQVAVAEMGRRG